MLDRIIEIINEQLNIDDAVITEETSFKDDLGVDSLDLLELVMAFEEEYNIELNPEELEGIQTVGDVMDYIKKYTDQ
ncbi:MAG: acyl carrier protein [Lachnospiraceae bacterium]|jgi:acyl carrier protein|nr:acyl carrier protein [Lachnospiraceae bacterium]MBP5599606.1 acyl carrier protein [Lachnospiraceae bacterium]MBQ3890966.1 acyl carrier protein [Lachnospiraceae bacterium]MBQ9862583.1 acyl carrier protein [Lachnospiraceae bacterium]MBR6003182.1 acyl carrier protein [Lachnospiraceae bacterium]